VHQAVVGRPTRPADIETPPAPDPPIDTTSGTTSGPGTVGLVQDRNGILIELATPVTR
jgi:hypothetical protein